jgi:hypothetical protein
VDAQGNQTCDAGSLPECTAENFTAIAEAQAAADVVQETYSASRVVLKLAAAKSLLSEKLEAKAGAYALLNDTLKALEDIKDKECQVIHEGFSSLIAMHEDFPNVAAFCCEVQGIECYGESAGPSLEGRIYKMYVYIFNNVQSTS